MPTKILNTLLLSTLLFFSACDTTDTKTESSIEDRLNTNKKLWSKSTLKNYSFVVRKSCFCPDLKKKFVEVKNSKVSSVKYIPSNEILTQEAINKEKVIPDYFSFIQDAIDREAHDINVTYNSTYGYPEKIKIDYTQKAVDEEMYYEITHFNKTNSDGTISCTEEYAPVCATVAIQCITVPCEKIQETFSNRCYLDANPLATYLKDGEC